MLQVENIEKYYGNGVNVTKALSRGRIRQRKDNAAQLYLYHRHDQCRADLSGRYRHL